LLPQNWDWELADAAFDAEAAREVLKIPDDMDHYIPSSGYPLIKQGLKPGEKWMNWCITSIGKHNE
jgi:hypothetical protein